MTSSRSNCERIARVAGARELAVSADGRLAVSTGDAIVFVSHRTASRPITVETWGIRGALSGLTWVDEESLAICVTPSGEEPWLGSCVVRCDPQGRLLELIGEVGISVVEPHVAAGKLWVLTNSVGAFVPTVAGEQSGVLALDTGVLDVGEVPLGTGRSSYLPYQDGVSAVTTASGHDGLVRLQWDQTEPRSYWMQDVSAHGAVSSLFIAGDEVGYLHSSLHNGVELCLGSQTLLACRPSRSFDSVVVMALDDVVPGERGFVWLVPQPRGLVLWVHGGPIGNSSRGYNPKLAYLLDQGYLVVAPEYPGSWGYGNEFREALHHGYGEVEVTALAALLGRLLSEFPLPVLGVGASSAGCTLLRLVELVAPRLMGLALSAPVTRLDTDPADRLLAWLRPDRVSQEFLLPRRFPMLISHGDRDTSVPVEDSRRFAALYGDQLDLRLEIFQGEGHSFSRGAQLRELQLVHEFVNDVIVESWRCGSLRG